MANSFLKDDKYILNIKLHNIFNSIINASTNYPYYQSSYESRKNKTIYSNYHSTIKDNIKNPNNITYILHSLSKEILFAELVQDKIKLLNLLPEFYFPFLSKSNKNADINITLVYPYLSRILTVIQNNLSLNIQPKIISEIFGKIVIIIFKNENELKKKIKNYEICQGFCFYNMKQNEYKNQICGVLCLKELITNTNYYIGKNKHIKNIFEKIILFFDNNNFEPKEYLIELLGNFITKCQQYYKPYINITVYKLLNYIESNCIALKRKIINILGLIITTFPYEFRCINNSLINFLTILSKDKDEYIKNKANQILNEFINTFNINLNTNSTATIYDKNYTTLTSFRKNSSFFNKDMKNSIISYNVKNEATISKSTRYASSSKYIRDTIKIISDYNNKNMASNKNSNKKNRKNSARFFNINYYRNHYKMMKENYKNNNEKNCPKTFEGNQKSLIFNLNRLKNDINNMSSSLNNHVVKIENKVLFKNLNI